MLTAIGMSIFGGGFTLGVKQTKKYEILGQWEEGKWGMKTFDLNFKKSIPRPLTFSDWPIKRFEGRVNLVYANPPCAPWSAGNTRKGMLAHDRYADPRLAMSGRAMETGMQLGPDVFVLESVARAYSIGLAYYQQWAEKWMEKGYAVTFFLSDALLHGVASTRQRFHFIAHKKRFNWEAPDMKMFMPRTVRHAIHDIQDMDGMLEHHDFRFPLNDQVAEVMRRTEPGGQLNAIEREWKAYTGPRHSFMVRKALWDAPAFTVIKLDEIVHPDGERMMTWREGLRLCGYPDSFKIHAPNEATQAVLPPVAKYVAERAAEAIGNGRSASVALSVVDWRALAAPYRPGAVREEMRRG